MQNLNEIKREISIKVMISENENKKIDEIVTYFNTNKSELIRDLILGNIKNIDFLNNIHILPVINSIRNIKENIDLKKEEKVERKINLLIRVNEIENNKINEIVQAMGMPKAKLIRHLLFGVISEQKFMKNIGLLPLIKNIRRIKEKINDI